METSNAPPPAAPPVGDHHAATAILHSIVDCTVSFIDGLSRLVDTHLDTEPAISLRVLALNHEISRAVLRWIEQWPSTAGAVS